MPTTIYTIEVVPGIEIETESTLVAQLESEAGSRVTARTEAEA